VAPRRLDLDGEQVVPPSPRDRIGALPDDALPGMRRCDRLLGGLASVAPELHRGHVGEHVGDRRRRLPRIPSDLASSGGYAVKHNPAAYYVGIRSRCRRWDLPLGTTSSGSLASDLAHNRLPAFSFVTPNLCDDMHDCPVATGDAWLRRWIPRIVSSAGYQSGTTVLFITFDEGTTGANRVATIVVSPSTRPATTSATAFDHFSLLKTTEQLLGLQGRLAHAGDSSTHDMRSAFDL